MLCKIKTLIILFHLAPSLCLKDVQQKTSEDHPVREFVEKYGYPLEPHRNIETEDGYLLDMYRIPHGKSGDQAGKKPAVLLLHGLISSCEDFVVSGPERGLGFLLADNGFDVWLGNSRGNFHSRKHVRLDPDVDRRSFWNFSFHELGVYDLPAMISHVLNATKQDQLFYVGFSQGTSAFFAMSSTKPELNKYIKLMVALAPVAYVKHIRHELVPFLVPFSHNQWFLKLLGPYELKPSNWILKIVGSVLCNEMIDHLKLCVHILFLFGGGDVDRLNQSLIHEIIKYDPAGASTKQWLHYIEEYQSGHFCQFDHGPDYDISKISSPVAIYHSHGDILATTQDVERLASELPNLVKKYVVDDAEFSHLDFVFASDVFNMLYAEVIEFMKTYL